jgi:hypothetical protein
LTRISWIFVAALAPALMAFDSDKAAAILDGEWRNSRVLLAIDSQGGTGTVAVGALPVQKGSFQVKKVSGQTVLFTIGERKFIGQVSKDELKVSIGNDPSREVLRKVR